MNNIIKLLRSENDMDFEVGIHLLTVKYPTLKELKELFDRGGEGFKRHSYAEVESWNYIPSGNGLRKTVHYEINDIRLSTGAVGVFILNDKESSFPFKTIYL